MPTAKQKAIQPTLSMNDLRFYVTPFGFSVEQERGVLCILASFASLWAAGSAGDEDLEANPEFVDHYGKPAVKAVGERFSVGMGERAGLLKDAGTVLSAIRRHTIEHVLDRARERGLEPGELARLRTAVDHRLRQRKGGR